MIIVADKVSSEEKIKFEDAIKECLMEVEKVNIRYGEIDSFVISTRFKRTWGQCKQILTNKYKISISSRLLKPDVPIKSLKNTIIHEILHTCKNCMNHGNEWKKNAEIVNKEYDYHIKRTSSDQEMGFKDESNDFKKNSYRVICTKCGYVYTRERKCNLINHPERYVCHLCRGELKVQYL